MITALDHIDIAVKDIDAAEAQYTALLGRKPAWKGEAPGMKQVMFRLHNTALNLLTHSGAGVPGEAVKARLDNVGEGVWSIAFRVDDLNATHKLLERRGIPTSPPGPIRSANPETGEKIYWNTGVVSTSATHGTQIFLVEQPDREIPISAPTGDELASVAELDHVVIQTPNPERAVALYGGRLGLDLRLDRPNPALGNRLLFFKLGNAVIEIGARLTAGAGEGPDKFGGLAWRVRKPDAINARLAAAGFNVSEVRQGRKPGTAVFTVRDKTCGVPTIMIEQGAPEAD